MSRRRALLSAINGKIVEVVIPEGFFPLSLTHDSVDEDWWSGTLVYVILSTPITTQLYEILKECCLAYGEVSDTSNKEQLYYISNDQVLALGIELRINNMYIEDFTLRVHNGELCEINGYTTHLLDGVWIYKNGEISWETLN